MKEILDKLQEIKSASDHTFSALFICGCCFIGCIYLSDIKEGLNKNNTLLKTIINQHKDTVNTVMYKQNKNNKSKQK